VNAGKHSIVLVSFFSLLMFQSAWGQSVPLTIRQGNKLYVDGDFTGAIDKYDQALVEDSRAAEPKFNKANSYYRLDDLDNAMELYRQVAAESRDMGLVTKARYNLGNSRFQQGIKQRDSNLQKAVEELETSIGHWRSVLDIEEENEKAARNIEVARLIIKDIIDQINKQKDPNQPPDPNQGQQQQNQQQDQQQDPNQGQDQQQNAEQDPNEPEDPNQGQQQQPEEQQSEAPEETAEDILEKERQERKERQLNQRVRYRKVEKDW
jgi:Ca-activated chloride channel family protein